MGLENINMLARDPERNGRFWAEALGLVEPGMDSDDLLAGRLKLGEWHLDVYVERTLDPPPPGWLLHLDLLGGAEQQAVVERLLGLGATRADIGQGEVPWVVLADPCSNCAPSRPPRRGRTLSISTSVPKPVAPTRPGNEFCVLGDDEAQLEVSLTSRAVRR